jgi:hypothetical protein
MCSAEQRIQSKEHHRYVGQVRVCIYERCHNSWHEPGSATNENCTIMRTDARVTNENIETVEH